MANTISPNMSLIVPGVGTEPGPTWANDLNADLGILDQHNHSPGQGVQITPAGININTNLPMNDNSLTLVNTVNFQAHGSPLSGVAPNLGAVYVAGNELYYNDEAGNVVAITNNGSVNAGAGSITGLPSGTASASYSAGSQTFVFQSATSTPANVDGGSFIFRDVSANSHGITMSAPLSLAADYQLFLPASLPGTTSFLSLDSGGNISTGSSIQTAQIANQAVTQAKLAPRPVSTTPGAGGFGISTSSGIQNYANTTLVPITGLTVTITTTGRPVFVGLMADGNGTGTSVLEIQNGSSGGGDGQIQFLNGATSICLQDIRNNNSGASFTMLVPSSSFWYFDTPTAGTYTYSVNWKTDSTTTNFTITNTVLCVYEI